MAAIQLAAWSGSLSSWWAAGTYFSEVEWKNRVSWLNDGKTTYILARSPSTCRQP